MTDESLLNHFVGTIELAQLDEGQRQPTGGEEVTGLPPEDRLNLR